MKASIQDDCCANRGCVGFNIELRGTYNLVLDFRTVALSAFHLEDDCLFHDSAKLLPSTAILLFVKQWPLCTVFIFEQGAGSSGLVGGVGEVIAKSSNSNILSGVIHAKRTSLSRSKLICIPS